MRFFYPIKCKIFYNMTKYEATLKVKKLIQLKSKDEISKTIGITRPTLDTRLKVHNWKNVEIFLIKNLKL